MSTRVGPTPSRCDDWQNVAASHTHGSLRARMLKWLLCLVGACAVVLATIVAVFALQARARLAALLVHGLTDSPYSMRALADTLLAQGYYVVVLRLPGHGTIPSGLVNVGWEDWYESVVLAAKHAASRGGAGK